MLTNDVMKMSSYLKKKVNLYSISPLSWNNFLDNFVDKVLKWKRQNMGKFKK